VHSIRYAALALSMSLAGCAETSATSSTVPAHPQSSGAPAYAGWSWRLTSLKDGGRTVQVPASIVSTVEFRDGPDELLADDTINTTYGHYVATSTGFRMTEASQSLVGWAGGDPVREATIHAVDAVYTGGADVGAVVSGDQLVLAKESTTLIYVRDRPVTGGPTYGASSSTSYARQ
jgi:hypothetical protein